MDVGQRVDQEQAFNRIAQILGCKWSIAILDALAHGTNRPGLLARQLDGISPKVLHRCMNRLELDGIVERTVFAEVPPHVEYSITPMGDRLLVLVAQARAIAQSWTGAGPYSE